VGGVDGHPCVGGSTREKARPAIHAAEKGKHIYLDPRTERIEVDPKSQRLVRPAYQAPWKCPEQYLRKA
jgi:hypothetical protein